MSKLEQVAETARAAIEAMKGPTPEMVEAARAADHEAQYSLGKQLGVAALFTAMIDAILSETKP